MNEKARPDKVEVIVSALIINADENILLVKQPKWGNPWTLPGGHLLPGERLAVGAEREGKEETGLDLSIVGLVSWGELFQERADGRAVHFIYFDYLFKASNDKLHLDPSELSEARWVSPAEALTCEITPGYRNTITKFIAKGLDGIKQDASTQK